MRISINKYLAATAAVILILTAAVAQTRTGAPPAAGPIN
jgi:hypothetical protein